EDETTLRAAMKSVKQAQAGDDNPLIIVLTKCDRPRESDIDVGVLGADLGAAASVAVSAETGAGVQRLLTAIGVVLGRIAGAPELDAPLLTQTRHQHAVGRALGELEAFRRAWRHEMLPATIAAVHLHEAGETLRDLIGGIDTEQVLDEVFRRFCVGK
ncbi:MAG TPA: hypothetical protein VGP84_05280, partial [Gemmatimonadaceae bacterium]|nr:hypothetical protein [Gemmatimonadaceae bacterium]